MFSNRLLYKLFQYKNQCIKCHNALQCRLYKKGNNDSETNISRTILSKYEAFRDDRAPVILDVEEERRKQQMGLPKEEEPDYDPFQGIDPKRGTEGVIDIEEAVAILRRENAIDLFVAEVPPEYRYVHYIVIVTGRSLRHMLGIAEFMRKVYKYKRNENESIPMIEGKTSEEWMALDLGNIALHIFSRRTRSKYDLETLWSVGKEFDPMCNAPNDPVAELLSKYSTDISQLTPNDCEK